MSWNFKYFTEKEMACHCGCGKLPKPEFMHFLEQMRERADFPFIITSGARCADYNFKITGKRDGAHVRGLAADIKVYGERALKVVELALQYGMTGLGINQKDGGILDLRYIHVDSVPAGDPVIHRPMIWSY